MEQNKNSHFINQQLANTQKKFINGVIILIIITSVSIFGLIVFVFVKNIIKKRINYYLNEKNKKTTKD